MDTQKTINDNVLWIEVNLKTSFYQPEKLEKGLWFMNSLYPGTEREFVELWELQQDIASDQYDDFISMYGFPVHIFLTVEMQNPDETDDIIAFDEEIGWMYDIDNESMRLIDIQTINLIIENYNCKFFLLIDAFHYDEFEEIVPEKENNLVIVTYPFEEEEEDNDDDDGYDAEYNEYGTW